MFFYTFDANRIGRSGYSIMSVHFVERLPRGYNWVVYPLFAIGTTGLSLEKYESFFEHITSYRSNDIDYDTDLALIVWQVVKSMRSREATCFTSDDGYTTVANIAACVLQAWHRIDGHRAMDILSLLYATRHEGNRSPDSDAVSQILRYKRPLRVIFCGDRNSSVSFSSIIQCELRSLPKYSTIIHGNCRGIDKLSGELAASMGISVEVYPADWSLYGPAAGPIRNLKMINSGVDMIYAFHPDIRYSKGTLSTVHSAWQKGGIDIFIFDLKRKLKYAGCVEQLENIDEND